MNKKGYNWGVERSLSKDMITGVEVTRLTNYKGHHHHLYFTNPGWYDSGNKIVVSGDRSNQTNLFSIDLRSGEITQLTDLPQIRGKDHEFLNACLNPVTNEMCYWYNNCLWAISLDTLEERPLWTLPEKQNYGMPNISCDGKHIIFCISEDASDKINMDLGYGYVGFEEYFEYKPLSQIIRVPVDGKGKEDVLFSGNVWLSHLNTSPTISNYLTFCHEGPWDKVENRIWAMDTSTGKIWPLRERRYPEESIGHEYWFADGKRIGYHGHYEGKGFLGSVNFDGSDIVEGEFPQSTVHVFSNDSLLAVGDGSNHGSDLRGKGNVMLWLWNGNSYDKPRILCSHRSSMHIQATHVHPRLSPDGSYVLFTSDRSGYGAPYITKLPADVASLPFA